MDRYNELYMKEVSLSKVIVYDNGGKTMDRYTVIINRDVYSMSSDPLSPSGVNLYAGEVGKGVKIGSHLGKKLKQIPKEIQQAIEQRISEK